MAGKRVHAAATFATKVIGTAGGLFLNIYLARHLGPEQFGIFSLAVGIAGLFSIVSKFGLDTYVLREVAAAPPAGGSVLGAAAALVVVIAAVAAGTVVLIDVLALDFRPIVGAWFYIAVVGMGWLALLLAQERARKRPLRAQINESIIRQGVFLVAILIISYQSVLDFRGAIIAHAISYAITVVAIVAVDRQGLSGVGCSKESLVRIGGESAVRSFFVISLAGFVWQRSDLLLVGYFLGESEAGIYSVALRTSELLFMLMVATNQVTAPYVAKAFATDSLTPAFAEVKTITRFTSLIGIILVVAAIMALPSYLALFGPRFSDAAPYTIILLCAQLMNLAFGPAGMILNMTGRERHARNSILIVAACSIPLYATLILMFGLTGAAIGTVVSIFLVNFLWSNKVYKDFGYRCFVLFP